MLALAFVAVSNADVNGFLLAVQLHIGGERGILLLLGAYHGQVCAGLDVAVDHVIERYIGNNVAVRYDYIVCTVLLQEVNRTGQCVNLAAVLAGYQRRCLLGVGVRRQQGYAAVLAGKIPVLGIADVVDQGLVLVLHQYAHAVNAAVYHIGKHKVDNAIPAAPLYRTDRAVLGDLAEIVVGIKCNDHA